MSPSPIRHCDRCGEPSGYWRFTPEAAADLEARGWTVALGMFNEVIAVYCEACADSMLARMAALREAWHG